MNKKRMMYFVLLIVGFGLIIGSLLFVKDDLKTISGIMMGSGSGLVGLSLASILSTDYLKRHPENAEMEFVELTDERNISIRYKAKAKAGEAMSIALIIVAFIGIAMDISLWIILMGVGLYLTYHILYFMLIMKYQKNM